jgi:hypothetical protein
MKVSILRRLFTYFVFEFVLLAVEFAVPVLAFGVEFCVPVPVAAGEAAGVPAPVEVGAPEG